MNGRSALKWVLGITLAVGLILAVTDLLVATLSVLLLIFAGLLFGVLVHGLASWPARRIGIPYIACYVGIVILIFAVMGLGFFYLGQQIAQRTDELWSQLQSSLQQAREQVNQMEWAKQVVPEAKEVKGALADGSSSILPKMFQGLQWVAWSLTGAVVIFFIGLYAAFDPDLYRSGIIKLFPFPQRDRVSDVLDKLRKAAGLWIIGRLLSMSIVGIVTGIGLWMLNVPLPITLGVLAALLTFVPNFGPLLAAAPQVLLALNVSTSTAIYVVIFNIVLQGVESYLLTPLVEKHEVSLPPILTISAQLVMGVIAGVIGVMMAAPLVVVIMVLVQTLYIRDRLGDQSPGELSEKL
jgi:predicted PurR-regulated permease PerM